MYYEVIKNYETVHQKLFQLCFQTGKVHVTQQWRKLLFTLSPRTHSSSAFEEKKVTVSSNGDVEAVQEVVEDELVEEVEADEIQMAAAASDWNDDGVGDDDDDEAALGRKDLIELRKKNLMLC